jgi:metal-dependent amidase/aminoacylase/carboxypeptidase family protein
MAERAAQLTQDVLTDLDGRMSDLVGPYQQLHTHPGPSMHEERAAATVAEQLTAAGLEVTERVDLPGWSGTGGAGRRRACAVRLLVTGAALALLAEASGRMVE